MAIYRLTIEVLQGTREGDDPENRAAALEKLREMQALITGRSDVAKYTEADTAPWGTPRRADVFSVDFDSELAEEKEADRAVLLEIGRLAGLLGSPSFVSDTAKVYVVCWEPYHDNGSVLGAFDSLPSALTFARGQEAKPGDRGSESCSIYECEPGTTVHLLAGPFTGVPSVADFGLPGEQPEP